jgi:hypothetical protein
MSPHERSDIQSGDGLFICLGRRVPPAKKNLYSSLKKNKQKKRKLEKSITKKKLNRKYFSSLPYFIMIIRNI